MAAVCKITDGVDSVSLIGDAFFITDWRQAGVPFKDDGYWQDSVFGEGRRLKQYAVGNISETITLAQTSVSQDEAIYQVNKLSGMLLDAADFSTHPKNHHRPVYLEVRASGETNTRYARIHAGFVGDYANPFSQPFLQPGCRASATGVNVIIERGPWLEVPPGQDTCQVVAPTGNRIGDTTVDLYYYDDLILNHVPPQISYAPFAFYKLNETSGTTAINYSTYGSSLDGTHDGTNILASLTFWSQYEPTTFISIATGNVDIYSSEFNSLFSGQKGSVLLWINTSGLIWTGGNQATFVNLRVDADNRIVIAHPGSPDNSILWRFVGEGEIYDTTETNISPTQEWFSVGATWSDSVVNFYRNGALIGSHDLATSITGNLSSTSTVIGAADNSGTYSSVSNIAYAAFWNETLTPGDMAKIGQVSSPLSFNVDFDPFDCESIIAYVANKSNSANLTHAFWNDSSATTFSSNLIGGSPPYGILPPTIGANDALYLGIEQTSSSALPDGPFNNLVFDITTGANATTSYATSWEYWDGGSWTALPNIVDRTAGLNGAFERTGIRAVHWDQPGDWDGAHAVNSVTGFWVRLIVDSVSGTWTQPIASDEPYTVTKNAVTVPKSQTGGSMPALARIEWTNDTAINAHRVVAGLRLPENAPNFRSYINIADEQNFGGILVTAIQTDTSYEDNMTAAAGRVLDLTEASGAVSMTDIFRISVINSASSYLGTYKAFIIYNADADATGADTEFGYRVSGAGGSNAYTIIPTGNYINSSNHTVHEIGEVTISPDSFLGDEIGNVEFVWRSEVVVNMTVDFYALVLIPTHDWFGDFDGIPVSRAITPTQHISIDGTRYVDRAVVASVRNSGTDSAVGNLTQSHNGPPHIPSDDECEFHFLFMADDGNGNYEAIPTHSGQVKIYRNRRYHYGRGGQ